MSDDDQVDEEDNTLDGVVFKVFIWVFGAFAVVVGIGVLIWAVMQFTSKAHAEVFLSAPSHRGEDEFAVFQVASGVTLLQDRETGREYISDGHGFTLRREAGCVR